MRGFRIAISTAVRAAWRGDGGALPGQPKRYAPPTWSDEYYHDGVISLFKRPGHARRKRGRAVLRGVSVQKNGGAGPGDAPTIALLAPRESSSGPQQRHLKFIVSFSCRYTSSSGYTVTGTRYKNIYYEQA
jgi:hypothetical protein